MRRKGDWPHQMSQSTGKYYLETLVKSQEPASDYPLVKFELLSEV
jgi:hypothetical protein